ncbi:MAG: HNH endonuclease [Chloroflexota bacterium]|nr:HNH endonuclease [Chloroflexota bacterium]
MRTVRAPKDGWPADAFAQAVRQSTSIVGVLRVLGVTFSGTNYRRVHLQVARERLDTSHWLGKGYLRGGSHAFSKSTPLAEILVEHSTYSNLVHLKRRLIAKDLLPDACNACGITDWRGKRLVLHLDHVNGVGDDHRLDNLRLLCPNCHSQTATYCGRNAGWLSRSRRDAERASPQYLDGRVPEAGVEPA